MEPDIPASPSAVRLGGRSADSPRLLREINDRLVLDLLLTDGPLTRARIGSRSGLSKPTVSSLLARLQRRGLVTTVGTTEGGPGPKAQIYTVDPSAAHVIAVHVEQHGSVAAIAGLTGEVIATAAVDVPARRSSSPVDEISEVIARVLQASGVDRARVHQVLVATPGVIDPATGRLRHARHLQGWESPELPQRLSAAVGLPIGHGNDVNLAAVAEGAHGAARGRSDYALLWLDRGVGLGLVLDGRLRSGAHGGAGEIGYLPVPGVRHPRVDRGGAGAFQQLVGGQGLRAMARRHGIRGQEPAAIVAAAVAGDRPGGDRLLDELAEGIAVGAAAVSTLVDPGLLVLGGPVGLAGGERLLAGVQAQLRRLAFVRPPMVLSEITSDGVLRGAVEVALSTVRADLFGASAPDLPAGVV